MHTVPKTAQQLKFKINCPILYSHNDGGCIIDRWSISKNTRISADDQCCQYTFFICQIETECSVCHNTNFCIFIVMKSVVFRRIT